AINPGSLRYATDARWRFEAQVARERWGREGELQSDDPRPSRGGKAGDSNPPRPQPMRQGKICMAEFWQVHTQEWLELSARRGYRGVTPLAAGVEGAIYDLGDSTVAKVWGQRREAELSLMQRFYADLASAGLPFATPEILAVEDVGGTAVTFERKLPGE